MKPNTSENTFLSYAELLIKEKEDQSTTLFQAHESIQSSLNLGGISDSATKEIQEDYQFWLDLSRKSKEEIVATIEASRSDILTKAQKTFQDIIKKYLSDEEYKDYARLLQSGEGGFLNQDIVKKIGENDPEFPILMVNIISHFDQVSRIADKKKQQDLLVQFPMRDKESYNCPGGSQSRLTMVALQYGDPMAQIFQDIIASSAQKLSRLIDFGNEAHITSLLQKSLGFNQADKLWHTASTQTPAEELWKFVKDYHEKLTEQFNAALAIEKKDILAIAQIFDEANSEDPVGPDAWYECKTKMKNFVSRMGYSDKHAEDLMSDFFTPVNEESFDTKLNKEKVKTKLQSLIEKLLSPIKAPEKIQDFDLYDKDTPGKITEMLKSSDPYKKQLAIQALWILSQNFAGNSPLNLLRTLELIGQGDSVKSKIENAKEYLQSLATDAELAGFKGMIEEVVSNIYDRRQKLLNDYGVSQEIDSTKAASFQIPHEYLNQISHKDAKDEFLSMFSELLKRNFEDELGNKDWAKIIFYHPRRDEILKLIKENKKSLYITNDEGQTSETIASDVWNSLFIIAGQKQDEDFLAILSTGPMSSKILPESILIVMRRAIHDDNKNITNKAIQLLGGPSIEMLISAVLINDLKFAEYLINRGIDVNNSNRAGDTPLVCAVFAGYYEIAEFLISKGADIILPDMEGNTALFHAATLKRIVEEGDVVEIGDEKMVRILLKALLNKDLLTDIESLKLIDRAIVETIGKMSEQNANPNYEILELLNDAALAILPFVNPKKAESEADDSAKQDKFLLFKFAIENNYVILASSLIVDIVDKEQIKEATALAIECRSLGIVDLLVGNKIDVNEVVNEDKDTPFTIAANSADVDTMEVLLNKGADINKPNGTNKTPLHIVITDGWLPGNAIFWLIDKGADLNAKDSLGNTPLHYLVTKQTGIDSLEMFFKDGVDINSSNKQGETPFIMALKCGASHYAKLIFDKLNPVEQINSLNFALIKNDKDLTKKVMNFVSVVGNIEELYKDKPEAALLISKIQQLKAPEHFKT